MPGAVVYCFQERVIPTQAGNWEEEGRFTISLWMTVCECSSNSDRAELQGGEEWPRSVKSCPPVPEKGRNRVISGKLVDAARPSEWMGRGRQALKLPQPTRKVDCLSRMLQRCKSHGSMADPAPSHQERQRYVGGDQGYFCSFVLLWADKEGGPDLLPLELSPACFFPLCTSAFVSVSCHAGWHCGWFWDNWGWEQ